MVVALIALSVALGGTGYAATKMAKNSVGNKQIKRNAVTGDKVKDGSLFRTDFAAGQIPQGPQGPQGAPGAPGPQGPAGPSNLGFGRMAPDGTLSGAGNLAFTGRGTSGAYCFDYTPGLVRSAQATVDSANSDTTRLHPGVNVDPPTLAAVSCPAGTDFFVTIAPVGGSGIDAGFFVLAAG
jgi:hypothetical protein